MARLYVCVQAVGGHSYCKAMGNQLWMLRASCLMLEIHIEDFEGCIGGCPTVVAQWQNTGYSGQRCPGFNSRWLPAFSLSSIFFWISFIYQCGCLGYRRPICTIRSWEASCIPQGASFMSRKGEASCVSRLREAGCVFRPQKLSHNKGGQWEI